MSKFEHLENILVSDISEENCLTRKYFGNYKYLYTTKSGKTVVVGGSGESIMVWNYAVKIPKKEYIPFTMDTFPKDVIWLRNKEPDSVFNVIALNRKGVKTDIGFLHYDFLLEEYEISTDFCKTWQPAGESK